MQRWFPILQWLPKYSKNQLLQDLPAGLVVGIMLIPQGMAYAMLAGLHPVYGLYASIIPLIVYATFGTSRQLAVGPVAIISLLVYTGVSPLAEPGTESYFTLAVLLALMVGVLQIVLGLLKAGVIVKFLSHAVIKGFTAAAAIVIGISQLKHLIGVPLVSSDNVFVLLYDALRRLGEIHWLTLSIGIGSMVALVLVRRTFPRFPVHIGVVAASIAIIYLLGLDRQGVKIVGEVPQGFPMPHLPTVSLDAIVSLIPIAVTIALIGYLESIAISKSIASKEKYKIYPNQEFFALGLSNTIGSLFSSFPITGSFSRSAVNYQAGARSGMAAIITAFCVAIAVLFLTPLLYYLPNAALAAIVMVAVYGLIDVKGTISLFRVKVADGITVLITFIACLLVGIEIGIAVGVVFSLAVFIKRSAYPNAVELGYLEKHDVFKSIQRFPKAQTYPNLFILRVDAPLYFANMGLLEDLLERTVRDKPQLEWIIMDFSGVNDIDAVAIHDMDEIMAHYRKEGIGFMLAGVKGQVYGYMVKAGWVDQYGEHIEYLSLQEAVRAATLSPQDEKLREEGLVNY